MIKSQVYCFLTRTVALYMVYYREILCNCLVYMYSRTRIRYASSDFTM